MECDTVIKRKGRAKWDGAGEMPAFTLIEMLVVIGIIGILATIIVAFILPKAQQSALNTVNAELHQLETAIDTYHADFGAYPPDNPSQKALDPVGLTSFMTWNQNRHDFLAPLYYELEGAVANVDNKGALTGTYGTNGTFINQSDYVHYFGLGGPQNSSSASLKNYLTNLRPSQFKRVAPGVQVFVLTCSIGTPSSPTDPNLNPWSYNSSNPTNNPATYDLFTTNIVVGNTNYTMGNWSR